MNGPELGQLQDAEIAGIGAMWMLNEDLSQVPIVWCTETRERVCWRGHADGGVGARNIVHGNQSTAPRRKERYRGLYCIMRHRFGCVMAVKAYLSL